MVVEIISFLIFINSLYIGNPLTGTFTNSEDPDEMPHHAAFHLGLHCLFMYNKIFRQKKIQKMITIQYFSNIIA